MLKLPNGEIAEIPDEKLTSYLLNRDHADGAPKAKFFAQFGFTIDQPGELAESLRDHAVSAEVTKEMEFDFGEKFVLEGPLKTPDGRSPILISVWVREGEQPEPRLVTAYPA
ncbi:MAG: hypothetical protein ACI8UO_000941 [Verrucomicrobiales bacterium]|jgi:hypothetical protein